MRRGSRTAVSVIAGLMLTTMVFWAQAGHTGQAIQGKSRYDLVALANQKNAFSFKYRNGSGKVENPLGSEEERLLREFAPESLVPLLGAEDAKPSADGSEATSSLPVDLDANDVNDVLVGVTTYGVTGAIRNSRIMARRGTDGSILWEKKFVGARAMLHSIGDLDGDGKNDLLVWIIKKSPHYALPLSTLRAVRGYDGADLWEAGGPGAIVFGGIFGDFDGDGRPDVFLFFNQYSQEGQRRYSSLMARRGYDGLPLWEEKSVNTLISGMPTGDLDGDGRSDVLVQITRANEATGGSKIRYMAKRVYDGATLWEDAYVGAAVGTSLSDDLDGDGKTDVLLRIAKYDSEGIFVSETAVARRGHDGSVLWQRKFRNRHFSAEAAGDLDGDGKTDVRFLVGGFNADADYEKILALKGSTGTALWNENISGESVYVGSDQDLDGDGRSDTLLSLNKYDDAGEVTRGRALAVRGKDGAHLWEERIKNVGVFANGAGDLNGDGKPDVLLIRTYPEQTGGSVKLKLGARRGSDGTPLWNKTLLNGLDPDVNGCNLYVYSGYDLNGSGGDDLVVSLGVFGDSGVLFSRLLALQGRDGSTFWSWMARNSELIGRPTADLDRDDNPDVVLDEDKFGQEGQARFARITVLRGDDKTVLWSDRFLRSDVSSLTAGDLDGR